MKSRPSKPTSERPGTTSQPIRVYDFENTPVLIVHPLIESGETIIGTLGGTWTTRQISRSQFEVVDIDAFVTVPRARVAFDGATADEKISFGTILVKRGVFTVPTGFQSLFVGPNTGNVDVRGRVYTAVLGLHVHLPTLFPKAEPAPVLMRILGSVQKGGALVAAGHGMAVSGWLAGAVLSCGHKTSAPAPAPAKCNAPNPNAPSKCCLAFPHPGNHMDSAGVTWP